MNPATGSPKASIVNCRDTTPPCPLVAVDDAPALFIRARWQIDGRSGAASLRPVSNLRVHLARRGRLMPNFTRMRHGTVVILVGTCNGRSSAGSWANGALASVPRKHLKRIHQRLNAQGVNIDGRDINRVFLLRSQVEEVVGKCGFGMFQPHI